MTGACPGITLDGGIDSDLIASPDDPTVIQVTGRYDGHRLLATSRPSAVEYPPIETGVFASRCPELRGAPSANGNDPQIEAVSQYTTSQPDYAALWWDRESRVLTVWFKGDDISAHLAAVADLAGDEEVCVAGGALFSEIELLEAAQLLAGFTDSRGLPLASLGYSVGGVTNRVDLPLEEIDASTRTALSDLVGERVVPYPYIDTLDLPLSELPDPVSLVEGDIDILTSRVRAGGGMAALALFEELHYDSALNCVYFGGPEDGESGRTVPVWPFGYAATSSPLTVYDYDGAAVVSEGEGIELGGGGVDAGSIAGNTCDADGAWLVNR
jgi:hypothetical protein